MLTVLRLIHPLGSFSPTISVFGLSVVHARVKHTVTKAFDTRRSASSSVCGTKYYEHFSYRKTSKPDKQQRRQSRQAAVKMAGTQQPYTQFVLTVALQVPFTRKIKNNPQPPTRKHRTVKNNHVIPRKCIKALW